MTDIEREQIETDVIIHAGKQARTIQRGVMVLLLVFVWLMVESSIAYHERKF